MSNEEYSVGSLENDYLEEWYNRGYDRDGDDLVLKERRETIEDFDITWKPVNTTTSTMGRKPRVANDITAVVKESLPKGLTIKDWWNVVPKKNGLPYVTLYPSTSNIQKTLRKSDYEDGRLRFEYPMSLVREKNLKTGQRRRVWIPVLKPIKTTRVVEIDRIPIHEFEFTEYVTGEYKSRQIDIEGEKVLKVGLRAPLGVRESGGQKDFWNGIFNEMKEEIFTGNEPTSEKNPANGVWWNRFLDVVDENAPNMDAAREFRKGLANEFSGKYRWTWEFNESKSDVGSAEDLVSKLNGQRVEEGIVKLGGE